MSFLRDISGVETDDLGLLQRIFLVCDGTLTDTLEAAAREPIALVKLAMAHRGAESAISDLDIAPGDAILTRSILLRGQRTGRCYAHADTVIAPDRLPAPFREDLVQSDKPLGRLWTEHCLESRKELLSVSRHAAPRLHEYFGADSDAGLLTRRYRLISGGAPVMLIAESFPVRYRGLMDSMPLSQSLPVRDPHQPACPET